MDRSVAANYPKAQSRSTVRRAIVLLFGSVLMAAARSGFCNGGLFELRHSRPSPSSRGWPLENVSVSSEQQAVVTLDQGAPEDVFVFESGGPSPIRLMVSRLRPYRLFCDLNGDGETQPGEVYQERPVRRGFAFTFNDVKVPLVVGDATRAVSVDVELSSFWRYRKLEVTRIISFYEGSFTVNGTKHQGLIELRSPFPEGKVVNEIVILDTDGNGAFDPLADACFSTQGVAYLDQTLWRVATVFLEATAAVKLEPYGGTTGLLEIKGDAIRRVRVRPTREATGQEAGSPVHEISLPPLPEQAYRLPAGRFDVSGVWLQSAGGPPSLYHLVREEWLPVVQIDVQPDATASVLLGGPLYEWVEVETHTLFRHISLEYGGLQNAAGLDFEPVFASPEEEAKYSREPSYELRDPVGNVIASGKFDYG